MTDFRVCQRKRRSIARRAPARKNRRGIAERQPDPIHPEMLPHVLLVERKDPRAISVAAYPVGRISHEAIYQALYVKDRGGLRQELTACLRTGRPLRKPRARSRRGKHFISPEVRIDQRPQEAADRTVAGHWEGDLILGLGGTAIGTLVERTSRFTMLLHLPPMDGHGSGPRSKDGPALAGHGADAVREAIASTITNLPAELRRSLTWDQGDEMAQHAQLSETTDLPVYFCGPHSPWQRPSNENTNGLLRQYFPKGTDLGRHNREDLKAVAATLNDRPRKTHDWHTPTELLNEQLTLQHDAGVVSSG